MDYDDNDDRSWLNALVSASVMDVMPEEEMAPFVRNKASLDGKEYETTPMRQYFNGQVLPNMQDILEKASLYPELEFNEDIFNTLNNQEKIMINKFLTPEKQPEILNVSPEEEINESKMYPKNDPTDINFYGNTDVESSSESTNKSLLEELNMEEVDTIEDFEKIDRPEKISNIPI
tara:strand:- start:1904 stop:2431 length:528 start_codon:yes stop_codon:yes gene_type:complete